MAEATAATTSRENHSLLDEDTKEDYDNFLPKKRSHGIKKVRALRVKLSGCTKYFYDECVWANQQTKCSYSIRRTYYQPNSPLAFAVMKMNGRLAGLRSRIKNNFLTLQETSS